MRQVKAVDLLAARLERRQNLGRVRLDDLPLGEKIAAYVEIILARLASIRHSGGKLARLGLLLALMFFAGTIIGGIVSHISHADPLVRAAVDSDINLIDAVEEAVEPKILALCNGIVFVCMTVCAADSEAQPDRAGRIGPIDGLFGSVFFGIAPPSRLVSVLR